MSVRVEHIVRACTAVFLPAAAACGGLAPGSTEPADGRVVRHYEVDHWVIRNPERGWVQFVHPSDPDDVQFVVGLSVSLANARVRLDAYRYRPIDDALLARLEAGFGRIRDAGLKLVLRFQYNIGSGKDPPLDRVLEHIDQLAPLLQRNADVIAVLQAGFIGAWGEWHTSISGLTEPASRAKVLGALLEALPRERSVQVRSPVFKKELAGGPLTADTAHTATPVARVGHHNDCLFADETDGGTFPTPEARSYLEQDGAFVPVGGETCAPPSPPRTDCEKAIIELRRFHYSYLNRAYHPDVIEAWKRQGCYRVIERDLGYRLVLRRASWPASVRAGHRARVSIRIENLGFAAPYNPRPVYLVVGRGETRHVTPLPEVDIRTWRRGQTYELDVELALPADFPAGSHWLRLWLPDDDPRLRDRPEYAIRLSNEGTWLEKDGTNYLGRIAVTE